MQPLQHARPSRFAERTLSLSTRISALVEQLDALIASGDTENAWAQVDELLALDAVLGWKARVTLCRVAGQGRLTTADTLGHLGGALFSARRFEEAAEAWAEAGEIYEGNDSPSAASMWKSAGFAFGQSGDHEASRAAYARCLDAFAEPDQPTHRYARLGVANSYLKQKTYEDAFTAAWWGLRLPWCGTPDASSWQAQAELWLALGYASFHTRRYSLADYAFRAVAEASHDSALNRDAAEALEAMRTGLAEHGLPPTPIVEASGRSFRVVWVGREDSMLARVDAGVFLAAGRVLSLGDAAEDPR